MSITPVSRIVLLATLHLIMIASVHAQSRKSPVVASHNKQIRVEQMPEFPGGMPALKKFLVDSIRYPAMAREDNIQGIVLITFLIKEDGSISDVKSKKDIGGGCEKEAIRVVKTMPKWKPYLRNGSPSAMVYELPVKFKFVQ
jgi:TonB family protein